VSGLQFDTLPEELRPPSLADGYRVQRIGRDELERGGFGRQGGWKIGCTTSVMQQYLHVESPVSGGMHRDTMWQGHHRFQVSPPRVFGVECEIAVRMACDLRARDEEYAFDEVAESVAAAMAAIEIVEDRYVDFQSLDVPTLVADDFFHYGCVVGALNEALDPRALRDATATMHINGNLVGEGQGTDILGDPLTALTWLVNHCASLGTPVLAGDIALLGSVVQTQWVVPGDYVEVHNSMLGNVTASFEAHP
jgi:2-oxo-3-hexenedioate decarboxylase/2-keto-4-pentenoate hydratase